MGRRPRKKEPIMYDTLQHRHVGRLRPGLTVRVRLGHVVRSVQILADPLPLTLAYKGAQHSVVLITGVDVTVETAAGHEPVSFVAVPDQKILVRSR
jgi:hypothetical protein